MTRGKFAVALAGASICDGASPALAQANVCAGKTICLSFGLAMMSVRNRTWFDSLSRGLDDVLLEYINDTQEKRGNGLQPARGHSRY